MSFEYNNLRVTIYEGEANAPLVIIHEDHNEGEAIWRIINDSGRKCTLACISKMIWEKDLAPWDAPASFKKGNPFTGGAKEHLRVIEENIIPQIEEQVGHKFSKKFLAGYSLAGLFAMYSTYLTDIFDGFVSASGSMWFPNFVEFCKEHEISANIKKAYFSIGDKEAKTKNSVMQPVEDNTRELEMYLAKKGIKTIFELNKGGHFTEDDLRLAKGIIWILKGERDNE